MAYIGIQPAEKFTSFATQEFSTSATTSYTLDHAVANENEIALFVNNVRQQPGSGKAYTATGTALTLSAATASTDTMYCIFLGRALQTVTPATNSITAAMVGNDLISGKDALAAIPATTDEFLISDAGTLKRIDAQFFQNTPAFSAYAGADQNNNSDNTWVKLAMNTEFFDTDSKYDHSSNYRFTPTIAGKYFFGANVYIDGNDTRDSVSLAFYKNGSKLFYVEEDSDSNTVAKISAIIELDSDDYVELYAKADVNNSSVFAMNQDGTTANNRAYWFGYKLVGV
jgi:hypothetical protein